MPSLGAPGRVLPSKSGHGTTARVRFLKNHNFRSKNEFFRFLLFFMIFLFLGVRQGALFEMSKSSGPPRRVPEAPPWSLWGGALATRRCILSNLSTRICYFSFRNRRVGPAIVPVTLQSSPGPPPVSQRNPCCPPLAPLRPFLTPSGRPVFELDETRSKK